MGPRHWRWVAGVAIGIAVLGVAVSAQGTVFETIAWKLQTTAMIVGRILAVVAIIHGGGKMLAGHRSGSSVGELIGGIALMVFAPQIMGWLFL